MLQYSFNLNTFLGLTNNSASHNTAIYLSRLWSIGRAVLTRGGAAPDVTDYTDQPERVGQVSALGTRKEGVQLGRFSLLNLRHPELKWCVVAPDALLSSWGTC